MKDCKFLRILTAMLALFGAIVLFGIALLTCVPFVSDSTLGGVVGSLVSGIRNVVAEISFLKSLEPNIAGLVFIAVTLVLPFALLLVASLVLFSKPKQSVGKYVFASVITVVAVAILCGITEWFCAPLLGETLPARLSVAGIFVVFAFLAILLAVLLCKYNKVEENEIVETAENVVEEDEPECEDLSVATEQVAQAFEEVTTAEHVDETVVEELPQEPEVEQAEQPEEQPQEQTEEITPANEYIPTDIGTISDIVDHTYGKKSEASVNMKKIEAARRLLDAGVISKDEYIALVDAYLKD